MAGTNTRTVEVTILVDVTTNDDAFTPEFMKEFKESFFHFDEVDEHAEHIAQLAARELADFGYDRTEFVEGYGPIRDFGIFTDILDIHTEIVDSRAGGRSDA